MDIRYALLCEGLEVDPDGYVRSILRIVRPGGTWAVDRFPTMLNPCIAFSGTGESGSSHVLTVVFLDGENPLTKVRKILTVPPSGVTEAWIRLDELTVLGPFELTVELFLDDNPFPFLAMNVPVDRF